MELIKLTEEEYTKFADSHHLKSLYQTSYYARFLSENNYEYDYIGLKDSYRNVRAATLIGFKEFDNNLLYGYAPAGFLINYDDVSLLKDFIKSLKEYYKRKNVIFIKINPNIKIGKLNEDNTKFIPNKNTKIINDLKKMSCQDLLANKYFESAIPKYQPIVNLKDFAYRNLNKNIRNKISKSYRKGFAIKKVNIDYLKEIYPFIKNKTKKPLGYYEALYHAFSPNNHIDLFIIDIDFAEYLENIKDQYQKELNRNNMLVNKVMQKVNDKTLKQKLQSDQELLMLKKYLIEATNGLSLSRHMYLGGAIVLKYQDTVTLFASGYNSQYKDCNANYYLHYKLMEYYKYDYHYFNLNAFSGDLSLTNHYHGLNEFILGFKPSVDELIGEFDIIINNFVYKKAATNGKLDNLFKNN
jgi:lipid II:glycine glycyltransferase (peptidoglycan interpeptide bridge formation enzyme)